MIPGTKYPPDPSACALQAPEASIKTMPKTKPRTCENPSTAKGACFLLKRPPSKSEVPHKMLERIASSEAICTRIPPCLP